MFGKIKKKVLEFKIRNDWSARVSKSICNTTTRSNIWNFDPVSHNKKNPWNVGKTKSFDKVGEIEEKKSFYAFQKSSNIIW